MSRYLIFIEVTETGFSAYTPDLLGCVSTGATAAGSGSEHERGDRISPRWNETGTLSGSRTNCGFDVR